MTLFTFYKLLFRATYLTVGMLLVWMGLDICLNSTVWTGMQISKSALTVEYCEFNYPDRFVHQPVNTYSNLAYFFFGVLILGIAREDARSTATSASNRLAGFPWLSALMGFCFIYLSLGSAFFHASLTYIGQRIDMNGTYSVLISLIGIALYHVDHRLRITPTQQQGWVLTLLVLILLFFKLALLVPSSQLVPILILLVNGLMVINYNQFPKERFLWLIMLGLALVVIAIIIRTLDVRKVGCDPHSFVQGHALWHGLTALSSFCSYAFFRFTGKAGNSLSY